MYGKPTVGWATLQQLWYHSKLRTLCQSTPLWILSSLSPKQSNLSGVVHVLCFMLQFSLRLSTSNILNIIKLNMIFIMEAVTMLTIFLKIIILFLRIQPLLCYFYRVQNNNTCIIKLCIKIPTFCYSFLYVLFSPVVKKFGFKVFKQLYL